MLFINLYIKTLVLGRTILFKGNILSFENIGAVWAKKAEKVIILTIFSALKIMDVKVGHPHDPKFSHSILGMDMQMNSIGLINISW